MSDYDLQFQADLEKAQALSLESLALEQFRRQKLLSSTDNVREIASVSARRREEEGPPPALPPPPRKPPRGRTSTTETPRSPGASPTREESSDLISFASPTGKSAPKDPHASLKEYIDQINKLGQQTEELTLSNPEQTQAIMNNQHYNQRPGYPYAPQYTYNYHQPYNPMPPYPPSTPYGMQTSIPTPMPTPIPNYAYYPPTIAAAHEAPPTYVHVNPAMYSTIPYNQTRMASPSPYAYPPPPTYNYNTTNMISRPTRPVSLYPQLSQVHTYPPQATVPQSSLNNNIQSMEPQTTVKTEPTKDKTEANNSSRKSSEVSLGSNESNDTIGSLPKSMNLIDFGSRNTISGQGSVRVSVLEAFDPLLTEQNNPGEWFVASLPSQWT